MRAGLVKFEEKIETYSIVITRFGFIACCCMDGLYFLTTMIFGINCFSSSVQMIYYAKLLFGQLLLSFWSTEPRD